MTIHSSKVTINNSSIKMAAVPHILLDSYDNPNLVKIAKEVTSKITREKMHQEFTVHLDIVHIRPGLMVCTISYPFCNSYHVYTVLSNNCAKVVVQTLLNKLQTPSSKPLKLSDFNATDIHLRENLKATIKKVEDPFVRQDANVAVYIDVVCTITKISIAISPGDMLMEKIIYETDVWFETAYSSMLLVALVNLFVQTHLSSK